MVATSTVSQFEARTPSSRRMFDRARLVMPGGNTRSVAHYDPYPLAIVRGEGGLVWDGDDNRYIDLNCNGLAIIHGQSFGPVLEAVRRATTVGTAWMGASEQQVAVAELLCERIPAAEEVRFLASGTEAGMVAAKVARRATGRPLLVKAVWGYHGGYDELEIGLHDDRDLPGRVRLAAYGDAADFERVIAEEGGRVAAIILEPASVMGAVQPAPEFLHRVRAAADRVGALLILDECITYRTDVGGLQQRLGVEPDLTMLGKFLGGGLPLGAIAGRRDVLDHFDPTRPEFLYHSGSYNGSRLACAASAETLRHLDASAIARMEGQAESLRAALLEAATAAEVQLTVSRVGSMLGFHFFREQAVLNNDPLQAMAREAFHLEALNHGVMVMPAEGVCCMSTAIDEDLIAEAGERLGAALDACSPELNRLATTFAEERR